MVLVLLMVLGMKFEYDMFYPVMENKHYMFPSNNSFHNNTA
jgi:hypothetical protein